MGRSADQLKYRTSDDDRRHRLERLRNGLITRQGSLSRFQPFLSNFIYRFRA